jgi:hypothetical protein
MRPENWGLFCVPAIFHFHEESCPRTPITMLNTCNSTARVGERSGRFWPTPKPNNCSKRLDESIGRRVQLVFSFEDTHFQFTS